MLAEPELSALKLNRLAASGLGVLKGQVLVVAVGANLQSDFDRVARGERRVLVQRDSLCRVFSGDAVVGAFEGKPVTAERASRFLAEVAQVAGPVEFTTAGLR